VFRDRLFGKHRSFKEVPVASCQLPVASYHCLSKDIILPAVTVITWESPNYIYLLALESCICIVQKFVREICISAVSAYLAEDESGLDSAFPDPRIEDKARL